MANYTVKQLSSLAGVSVRTLHHYDQLGLLKPCERAASGYRYYSRTELLRLQQILFYKELGFSLKKIKQILDEPDFDLIESLTYQRKQLQQQSGRLEQLMRTIDKTIEELKNQKIMLTDKELYEGFEKGKAYRQEAADRWGEAEVSDAEQRLKKLGKDGWANAKAEGEAVNRALAELIDKDPASRIVQEAIGRHHAHMNQFYEVSEARYRGLADMYVADERFKAHYDQYKMGLAEFIRKAIHIYCNNGMVIGIE